MGTRLPSSEICSRRGNAALRALWSSMMVRNLGQATMASFLGVRSGGADGVRR